MTRQDLLEATETLIKSLEDCEQARAVVEILKETRKYLKPIKIVLRHGDVRDVQVCYRHYLTTLTKFEDYQVKYK